MLSVETLYKTKFTSRQKKSTAIGNLRPFFHRRTLYYRQAFLHYDVNWESPLSITRPVIPIKSLQKPVLVTAYLLGADILS